MQLTIQAPNIYDPNDPTSQFYCDANADDPRCYEAGGYYATVPDTSGNLTLPVEVFNSTSPMLVGGALFALLLLGGLGKKRRSRRLRGM